VSRASALSGRVALLDIDPSLGEGLDATELATARERCTAAVVALRRGRLAWQSGRPPDGPGIGYFVIRGLLLRRVEVRERYGAELIGTGDVVHPYADLGERDLVSKTSWRAEQSTLLAVLDDNFFRASASWPQLQMGLQQRSVPRAHSLLLRLAIVEQTHIASRVELVLWHLADRWGDVQTDGVDLPFKLSRVVLAELVSSTRESVSRSLRGLEKLDRVRPTPSGFFLPFPAPTGFP
jgi:CRP-like cAMP-binding protein